MESNTELFLDVKMTDSSIKKNRLKFPTLSYLTKNDDFRALTIDFETRQQLNMRVNKTLEVLKL